MKKTNRQPTVPATAQQTRGIQRRGPGLMALEQRFMFDGAALVEGLAVTAEAQAPHESAPEHQALPLFDLGGSLQALPPALGSAQERAAQQINAFLAAPDAAAQLFQLFHGNQSEPSAQWLAQADAFLNALQGQDITVRMELRSHHELLGAFGAFAAQGPDGQAVIYLNRDWAASASSDAIARVLVEEFGHYIDHQINQGVDTAGDEGEAFAAAVRQTALSESERARIAAEADQGQLIIDGQSVTVERANISFSAVYQGTPSALSEEAQSLNNIQPLLGTGFSFTSSNPADLYFSGNNVTGTLSYTDGNGDPQTIYGVASRLFKTGNTVDGIYFYAPGADGIIGNGDTGETAYLLQVNNVFVTGSNNGTSSDPVDTALNRLLVSYQAPTAYADTSFSAGAQVAIEQGMSTSGQHGTGNVLTNDTGSATKSVTAVGTTSANVTVNDTTHATSGTGLQVIGTYGRLFIGADGSYRYEVDNSNPTVDALRDASSTLTDRFTYEVTDAEGNKSTTTLTVTIQGANDAPAAVNDVNAAKESLRTDATAYDATDPLGSRATGNVLDNDTDVDRYGETAAVDGMYATGDYVGHFLGSSTTNLTFAATASTLQNVGTSHYIYIQTGGNYTLLTSGGVGVLITGNTKLADGSYSITLSATPTNYTLENNSQVAFATSGNTTVTSGGSTRTAQVGASQTVVTSTVTLTPTSGTIQAGMSISGTGIPVGTRVTAVTDAGSGNLTLTLDKQLTTAPSGSITLTAAAGSTLTGRYGTLVLNANGSYVYTPFADNPNLAAGLTVTEQFEYTMRDAAGAPSTAILQINVTGSAATDPNAVNDINLTGATESGGAANTGGTPATGTVLGNDTTPSGTNTVIAGRAVNSTTEQTITGGSYQDITGTYGTLRLYSDGTYSYSPLDTNPTVQALNVGDTLTDAFAYRIQNTAGGRDTATLTITIHGANDHPQANYDELSTTEDTPLNIPAAELLANDVDVDSTNLSIVSVQDAVGGTVVLNGDGSVTFTPTPNFHGAASFTYTMTDGDGTSTATVSLTVTPVNDAPVAAPNSYTLLKNATLTGVNVITDNDTPGGLDSDPEADTLQISKVNGRLFNANSTDLIFTDDDGWMQLSLSHGTLFIKANGDTAYRPNTDDIAGDTFTYVLSDGQDESNATTVTFTVNDPSNTPAVIGGDAVGAVTEDLNVSAGNLTDTGSLTVTDPDAGEASFLTGASDITASADALGSLSITSAGAWTYTVANDDVQYLAAGQTKTETFTVKTVDGTTHDVVVTINGVNDPTVITGGTSGSGNEDIAITGTLTATDADGLSDGTVFTVTGAASNGTASIDPATGAWTYTPNADFNGTDSFTVTITDDAGNTTTQTITITVSPVADIAGDAISTDEDTAVTITAASLLANDSFEGTPSVTAVGGAVNGTVSLVGGNITFTPDANYNGPASFTYTVTSGGVTETATVNVTVNPVNDVAVIAGDTSGSGNEDTAITGTLTATDADGLSDGTVFTVTGAASNGTASIDPATGAWSYSPNADFNGADSFTVTITDDAGNTTTQTITITVSPVADIAGDAISTDEDTAVTITAASLLANDSFEGTPSVTAVGGAVNGTVSLVGGNITFTPDANYNGPASFTYTVTSGGVTETATVNVTVNPVNDVAVIAGDSTGAVTEDDTTPHLTDTGTLTISDVDTGEASFQTTGITASAGALGSLSITSTGVWTYSVPNAAVQYLHPGETKTETFTVRSTDGSTHEVVIVIYGVDDDRAITVAGLDDVSEGSNAVFTVALPGGNTRDTEITLALANTTAQADDYSALAGASAYYFDGATQVTLTITDGKVTLPDGVASFFVSVPTNQDTSLEGAEAFSLSASVTAGKSASDTATILDDGTGKVYDEDGTDSSAPGNDDRVLSVDSIVVNEGSPYAVFTVTGGSGQLTTLALAGQNGDGANLATLEYFDGSAWQAYTPGDLVALNGTSLLVRVALAPEQDIAIDGPETFRLVATNTDGTTSAETDGVGSIRDDGTGDYWIGDATTPATPEQLAAARIVLDDDRPKALTPATEPAAPAPETPAAPAQETAPLPPTLRFDSTMYPAAPLPEMPALSAEVLALLRPVTERADRVELPTLTRATGFQALVSPSADTGLKLNRSISDQFVEKAAAGSVLLPFDTFVHSRADATVLLQARQANGAPLPGWISFDPRSGTFTAQPPADFSGELVIEVTARDEQGNEVKTQFRLRVGDTRLAPTGRQSLSEQFRDASRQAHAWADAVRVDDRSHARPDKAVPQAAPAAVKATV